MSEWTDADAVGRLEGQRAFWFRRGHGDDAAALTLAITRLTQPSSEESLRSRLGLAVKALEPFGNTHWPLRLSDSAPANTSLVTVGDYRRATTTLALIGKEDFSSAQGCNQASGGVTSLSSETERLRGCLVRLRYAANVHAGYPAKVTASEPVGFAADVMRAVDAVLTTPAERVVSRLSSPDEADGKSREAINPSSETPSEGAKP